MINVDIKDMWPGVELIRRDPMVRATFDLVTKNLGISGYAIAKQLDKNPTEVQRALSSLREQHLIDSGSVELRENFTLTGAGFRMKQILGGL